jgi:hypothetical protein
VMENLASSLARLWSRHPDEVIKRLALLARKATRAPASHNVHDALAAAYFGEFLRADRKECRAYVQNLVNHVNRPAAGNSLKRLLADCRSSRLFVYGIPGTSSQRDDEIRVKVLAFANGLLDSAQARIAPVRAEIARLEATKAPLGPQIGKLLAAHKQLSMVIHEIISQLYFASGATAKEDGRGGDMLSPAQTKRFWEEARPLLVKLAEEMHPQSSSYLIRTLHHLLPYNPGEIFLLVAKSLRSSRVAGIQYDQLVAGEIVELVKLALADHREIFRSIPGQANPCLDALLEVLDQFVEAGWPEARKLTHRLEEIHR